MTKSHTSEGVGTKDIKTGGFALVRVIIVVAILLLVGTAVAWWQHGQTDTNRVFWGMVENSLSTPSVTRVVEQSDGTQTLRQVVQIQTTPTQLVNSKSVITQGGGSTRVVTESVGTPTTDYVRYTDITTTQKSSTGKDLDFSNIKNVWGKTEVQEDAKGKSVTSGQLYNELVLGIIPFSHLNADQRQRVIAEMQSRNVYKVTKVKTTKQGVFQRPSIVLNIEVNPQAYISVLKSFAKELGLNQLASIDPSQYGSAQSVQVQATIDGWTKQLTQMAYDGGRTENFSAYGSAKQLTQPPKNAVSINELQSRLQSIQ